VTMANGLPGLRVSGAIGDLIADRLLVEYRRNGTTDWQPAPDIVGQGQKALDIGPLDGVTDWDVRLAYRAGNQIGDWLEITPVGTGTNDLRDELEAQIASIASDDVLSRGEKPHVQREYDALYENWIALDAKASSLGIASAQRTAANAAMSVLYTYLSSLSPSWADTGNDTPIVGATFNAKWADAYAAVAALQAAIQGQPGADGTTFYDWHAYADSADGTVNFTTGAPLGRTWQGVRHGNTSPTESTNPADYTWTPYAGPSSVGFAGSSGTQVSGNKIVRTAAYTGGWDQQVYSTEGFYQGAQVKFQAIENGAGYGAIGSEGMGGFFIGLNTDPLTDSGFGSIDHGIQCDHTNSGTGNLNIIEGGTGFIIGVSTYVESDVFSIVYDNDRVRYYENATLLRDVYVGPDKTFYMDSSLGHPGTRGKVLNFGPAAKKGADGDDGYTVTPNGKSYSISANAAGIIRSGELPKSETFRVLKGLTDVSTDAATGYSISAWANVSVSLASNVLTIDDLSAETGFVEVAITRSGVPIAVARFDLGKAKDGTNASFAQTLIINPGNTGSYGSTGSDPLTIPVGPNGTVSLAARVSYSVPSLNSVQAAKWQYRATPGSGGWTDVAAETVDPVGATAGNPSTFNVTATIAGPAAGANWEFQLVTRRASGSSSSAAASGSNRASASWAP